MDNELPNKVLLAVSDPVLLDLVTAALSPEIETTPALHLETITYLQNSGRFRVALIDLDFMAKKSMAMSIIQGWRLHRETERARTVFVVYSKGASVDRGEMLLLEELGNVTIFSGVVTKKGILAEMTKAERMAKVFDQAVLLKSQIESRLKDGGNIISLKQKIETDPVLSGDRALINTIIELQEERLEITEAIDTALSAIKRWKTDLRFINAMGRLHLKSGDLKEAALWLERADQEAPGHFSRVANLFRVYAKDGQEEAAGRRAEELIGYTRDNAGLTGTRLFQGDNDQIFHYAGELSEIERSCYDMTLRLSNNHGVRAAREGRHEEARNFYAKAISYSDYAVSAGVPVAERIRFNIAVCWTREGLEKNDIPCLEQAMAVLLKIQANVPSYGKAEDLMERVATWMILKKTNRELRIKGDWVEVEWDNPDFAATDK